MNKRLVLLTAALLLLAGCGSKGGDTPAPAAHDGKSAETAFTLDEMIEEMAGYQAGEISKVEYYVTGKVATGSTYDSGYGSWSMYGEGHEKDSEKPFQFYSCQMDESITKNYKDNGCLDGATIVVKGYAQLYHPAEGADVYEICYLSKSKSPTGEATSPVILSVDGGTEFVPPQPTAMSIGNNFELAKNDTKQLTVAWTPANAQPQTVTWTSSAEGKATVSATGLVTGVAAGEATITATAGALHASVTVTVVEEVKAFDLNSESLLGYNGTDNVGYDKEYKNATVGGVGFTYQQIGAYGSGMQFRNKLSDASNGTKSNLNNTSAFASKITNIALTWNAGKNVSANNNVLKFTFDTVATFDSANKATVMLNTVADQKSYTVNAPEGSFTFVKIEIDDDFTYSCYWNSIVINIA